MKTVGIIGGLGPETTTKFYLELISAYSKRGERSYPSVLVYSVPLPRELEKECIIEAKNEEKCIPFLVQAAKNLEAGGADFIVLACNSLHKFIEDIREAVKIPVLSIIEETVNFLKSQNIKTVGTLATSITINNQLYKARLNKEDISEVVPDAQDQERLGQLIYDLATGNYSDADKKALDQIIKKIGKANIQAIILACTDLQLLTPQCDGIKIFDTMQILVDATVREMVE